MSITIGTITVIDSGNFDVVTVFEKGDSFCLKDSEGNLVISIKTGKPARFKSVGQAEKFAQRLMETTGEIKSVDKPKEITENVGDYTMTAIEWAAYAKAHPPQSVASMVIDGVKQKVVFDFCHLPHTKSELTESLVKNPNNRFAQFYLGYL